MVHFSLSGLKFLEGVLPLDPTQGSDRSLVKRPRIGVPEEIAAGLYYPEALDSRLLLMAAFTWTYLEQIGELCLQNQKLAIEIEDEVSRNWSVYAI